MECVVLMNSQAGRRILTGARSAVGGVDEVTYSQSIAARTQ